MAGIRDATLRQLQIFEAAARGRSFSKAARALHLTQPAVSMQMRQLEHFAGVPLFERVGRGIVLTDAGDALLGRARTVLRELDLADEDFAALHGLRGGRVRLAVTSTARYFAPRLIARFARAHPEVTVRLLVENRETVVRALAASDVDLALMGQPPEELSPIAVPFAEHPFVIIAAPDDPLAAGRAKVTRRALSGATFLVRERGSGTRSNMERYFARSAVTPRIGMEMASNETIKQAVMAGLGLSFISLHTIALELAVGAVALVRAPGLPVVRNWYVVHRRERRLSPASAAFKAFVIADGRAFFKEWRGGV